MSSLLEQLVSLDNLSARLASPDPNVQSAAVLACYQKSNSLSPSQMKILIESVGRGEVYDDGLVKIIGNIALRRSDMAERVVVNETVALVMRCQHESDPDECSLRLQRLMHILSRISVEYQHDQLRHQDDLEEVVAHISEVAKRRLD